MERFLVFKAHRLLYHSTLGLGVIKKKETCCCIRCPLPSRSRGSNRVTGHELTNTFSQHHGARLVHQTIAIKKWMRTSRLPIKNSPPWRQPRGKWMVSLVNCHTNATSNRWHLWEIDARFALNSTPGWFREPCQDPQEPVANRPHCHVSAGNGFQEPRLSRYCCLSVRYRGTSLIRNTHPPRITIGP